MARWRCYTTHNPFFHECILQCCRAPSSLLFLQELLFDIEKNCNWLNVIKLSLIIPIKYTVPDLRERCYATKNNDMM